MDREQVLFRLFGKYCAAGTILYTEGSPGEELFVIQSGAVRVGAAGGGSEVLGAGRVLGEEAFFGRVSRTGRAEVVKDSRLLLVSDRTLDAVARHGPEVTRVVAEQLLEIAGDAARRLDAWVLARQALRAEPHLLSARELSPTGLAELSGLAPGDARAVLEALAERGAIARAPQGDAYRVEDAAVLEQALLEMSAAVA
ncbi:MAG TPA: cyclic nucleotide-binding domain-containing protein [bacterium]